MPAALTARQTLSKTLFGQVHRLDVLIAAHELRRFSPTDLSERLGLAQSAIQAPLRDLLAAKVIEYVDVERRRNMYRCNEESLAWPWVDQLKEQAEREERAHAVVRALRDRRPS